MNEIDKWAETIQNYSQIDKIRDLYNQLKINNSEVNNIIDSIEKAEKENIDADNLEYLYENEFKLLMDNIGLYEDLILNLERIEKTSDNEFELAKIKRDANEMIIVEIIEL